MQCFCPLRFSVFADVQELSVDLMHTSNHRFPSVTKLSVKSADPQCWRQLSLMFPGVAHFVLLAGDRDFHFDDNWVQNRIFPGLERLQVTAHHMSSVLSKPATQRNLVELNIRVKTSRPIDWTNMLNPQTVRILKLNCRFDVDSKWWGKVQTMTVFQTRLYATVSHALLRPASCPLDLHVLELETFHAGLVEQERATLQKLSLLNQIALHESALPLLESTRLRRVKVRTHSIHVNRKHIDLMFQHNVELISFIVDKGYNAEVYFRDCPENGKRWTKKTADKHPPRTGDIDFFCVGEEQRSPIRFKVLGESAEAQ